MTIPDYQTLMLPLLKLANDQKEHSLREAVDVLSEQFKLSPEERSELLPNGRKTRFYDRVAWAGTYLRKAGLLTSAERGQFQITQRGLDVLKKNPSKIDVNFLEQFEEFIQFRTRRNKEHKKAEIDLESQTPEEVMDDAYQTWRKSLADEILEKSSSVLLHFLKPL